MQVPLRALRAVILATFAAWCSTCACIAVFELPHAPLMQTAVAATGGAALWFAGLSVPLVYVAAWLFGWIEGFGIMAVWLGCVVALMRRPRRRERTAWACAVATVGAAFAFGTHTRADTAPSASIGCIGDSSTHGLWVERPFCALLGGRNVAKPGSGLADLPRQAERLAESTPRFVLYMAGGNAHDTDDWRAVLTSIDAQVRAWGGRLVLIEYPAGGLMRRAAYRNALSAAPAGALIVHPQLHWWEVSGDHIHPTAAGHRRTAVAVAEALR